MNVGAETSIGRVRSTNEDSFWAEGSLLVVCDGMGGHRAGEVASRMAVDYVRSFPFACKNPEAEVRQAVEGAHQALIEAARENPDIQGMGTTITMALCIVAPEGVDVILGHVGDSRAYSYIEGQLKLLTRDHSVVGELARQGSLSLEEALQHPQRHVLSQALGIGEIDVEVQKFFFPSGSRILLCTDGLTDVLSDEEIKQGLGGSPPQEAAEKLVTLANEHGGRDNITVIIAQIP